MLHFLLNIYFKAIIWSSNKREHNSISALFDKSDVGSKCFTYYKYTLERSYLYILVFLTCFRLWHHASKHIYVIITMVTLVLGLFVFTIECFFVCKINTSNKRCELLKSNQSAHLFQTYSWKSYYSAIFPAKVHKCSWKAAVFTSTFACNSHMPLTHFNLEEIEARLVHSSRSVWVGYKVIASCISTLIHLFSSQSKRYIIIIVIPHISFRCSSRLFALVVLVIHVHF